jgi:hypothetical protein
MPPVTAEVLSYKIDALADDIAEIRRAQIDITQRINGMERTAQRDRGFIGGALFIASGLWMALSSFKDVLAAIFLGTQR